MRKLSNEDKKRIQKMSEEIFAGDGTVQENMVSAYVNYLPDKERKQGELMTERIYQMVENFHDSFERAKENPQTWIESQLEEIAEGKQAKESCMIYYNLILNLTAGIQEISDGDAAQLQAQVEAIYAQEDISDEEKSRILKEILKKNIEDNGAIMQKFTQILLEYAAENMTGEMRQDRIILEEQEQDLVAGMIMAAYIVAKEGKLEDIPSNITLDEISVLICMEYESAKIVQDAQNGKIAWSLAKEILRLIGIVAIAMLCKVAIKIGLSLISMIFGSMFLGSVFVTVLSFIFISSVIYCGIRFALKGSEKISELYIDNIAKATVDTITISFDILVTGLKRFAEFITDICKKSALNLQKMGNEILTKVFGGMREQSEETEVNESVKEQVAMES